MDADQGLLAGVDDVPAPLHQHPQQLRGTVGHHGPKDLRATSRDRGGVGVVGIGLVARARQLADLRRQLRRDVADLLACVDQLP